MIIYKIKANIFWSNDLPFGIYIIFQKMIWDTFFKWRQLLLLNFIENNCKIIFFCLQFECYLKHILFCWNEIQKIILFSDSFVLEILIHKKNFLIYCFFKLKIKWIHVTRCNLNVCVCVVVLILIPKVHLFMFVL